MTRRISIFTRVGFIILLVGCSVAESTPGTITVLPTALRHAEMAPLATVTTPMLNGAPSCPDPMAIIKSFYDSNDASAFDASYAFFTADATISTWAEGVNGRHWQEKHLAGKEQFLAVFGDRGFRRTSGKPDVPIFHEAEVKISGDRVTFMLRPDRLSPAGRPYNPYRVEVTFLGCKIRSLIVIEFISWE